ncbi:unnamed protein product [Paramecium sonneborni]|uniref:H(+)-exporting diphosphatase n=1 Tax=Paramecium sonneborni TaxID=65129 RepID=A0A8S1MRF0_9CILI|nr:unnamed protein product [Paramecium sonneborni]
MISFELSNMLILISTGIGLLWAVYNAFKLNQIKIGTPNQYNNFQDDYQDHHSQLLLEIASHIESGAAAFLAAEYRYIGVVIILLALLIFFIVEPVLGQAWTTVAFLVGALTSIISGFIGMRVATFSNYRCAYCAQTKMTDAFAVAYRAGCVMGFALVSFALLSLTILLGVYINWFIKDYRDFQQLFEAIAGYGLGGSVIALFGRVGGGIYTKAADVGADLVGKVENDFKEDSPNNPATIADNVGDNVGDIAGMGADLFGSFAEATCAALVVCSVSPSFYYHPTTFYYPLLVSAAGIVVCFIVSIIAFVGEKENFDQVSNALKYQLILSTLLMLPALYFVANLTLPERIFGLAPIDRQPIHAWLCTAVGLISGCIIGFVTEYYTSHSYRPVQEVAQACGTGAATNIIYGIALGNLSTIIPVFLLAFTAFLSYSLLSMFGVALSALGMLSTLTIGLAIDAYGPVSDNAGGIAEMVGYPQDVRNRTDQLDSAGNCTAAIGKGFAIGSAALVSFSLYGAFITRASNSLNNHPLTDLGVNSPLVFLGLLIGAMIPYWFSAFTLKSVGRAAFEMVEEVRRQLAERPGIRDGKQKPDYDKCIAISTKSSLQEMFAPGLLVILVPLALGLFLGPTAVAGLLPGILVSGVCMATSSANSGGAWDNAKKFIEADLCEIDQIVKGKGTDEHKAAVIGDTVGDPLKDTSGPSLNILIKLSAIFSLVFANVYDKSAWLLCAMTTMSSGCPA